MKVCSFTGCELEVLARGLCSTHYAQRRRSKQLTPIGQHHRICSAESYFHRSYIVDISTSCWVWQRGCARGGYGQFRVNGKMRLAHRFSYELHNGAISADINVCHTCDNPPCVNPAHLWLGSDVDNVRDMLRKDRQPKGEARVGAKLTADQVIAIRSAQGVTNAHLAREYGVSSTTIYYIRCGRYWRHIP